MPKITIDGQQAEFEEGLRIIRAAERLGIEIPHYCWHPGLTVAGNCRMCLVEIEKVPKLQIACNTRINDGMVVYTRNERVKKAQAAVLEFLLVNHPIDCPICDQAGECKLQEYYMDYDRKESRFPVEEKVHKRKVVDLGPLVVLDQERCILCLRCTRFLDEVTQTSELGVFERGDRSFIDLAPGRRLENPYSGNVVDICPVGALTSKDFRFQARVWYLKRTESVCTFCARGCNIEIHHREGRIFRFRPRYNPDVNNYWMCDVGRIGYKEIQGPNRLLQPEIRDGESVREVGWSDALETVRSRLVKIREAHGASSISGIVSAKSTNEEAFLLRRLLVDVLGSSRIAAHGWSPPGAMEDKLLLRADRTPNRKGLDALEISSDPAGVERILVDAQAGRVKALVVLGVDLIGELGQTKAGPALEELDLLVVIDFRRTETALYADLLLPGSTFAETDGTVVNFAGRVQRLRPAFPPPGLARETWSILRSLIGSFGGLAPWQSAEEVFSQIARESGHFSGMTFEELGTQGCGLHESTSAATIDPAVKIRANS